MQIFRRLIQIFPISPKDSENECPRCHQMVIPKNHSCPLCHYTVNATRVKFDVGEELNLNFCILNCPDKSEKECAECFKALKSGRVGREDNEEE